MTFTVEPITVNMVPILVAILGILGSILTLIALVGAVRGTLFLRRLHKAFAEKKEAQKERCRRALRAVARLESSCHLITMSTLIELGKLKPHETVRDLGLLKSVDTFEDLASFTEEHPVVFFSHQWLAWADPDPDQMQYADMVAACNKLCNRFGYAAEDLYLFVDYISIPQRNARLQRCAIDALGVIASMCTHFVVIAPSSTHRDTKAVCDKHSYSRRGWTRLEQWGHLCMNGMDSMHFYSTQDEDVQPLDDGTDTDWYMDSIMVFEGDFTRKSTAGLKELIDVTLGLYAMVMKNKDDQWASRLYATRSLSPYLPTHPSTHSSSPLTPPPPTLSFQIPHDRRAPRARLPRMAIRGSNTNPHGSHGYR